MSTEEVWIVTAPRISTSEDPWITVDAATKRLATNHRPNLPDFRFGYLDSLLKFVDRLMLLDSCMQSNLMKIEQNFHEAIASDESYNFSDNILIQDDTNFEWFYKFSWNFSAYPSTKTPQEMLKQIAEKLCSIFEEMKVIVSNYNKLKTSIRNTEAKNNASLIARDLSGLISKDDLVTDSKFITSFLIIVPSIDVENWKNYYEHFWHGIVPGSSRLIFQDHEFALYTLAIFKSTEEGFKELALKSRIVIKSFSYNEEEIKDKKLNEEHTRIAFEEEKKKLISWSRTNYKCCIEMLMHLRILRAAVESILRYGPQSDYALLIMRPKNKKKLQKALNKLYSFLEKGAYQHDKEEDKTCGQMQCYGIRDDLAYVCLPVFILPDKQRKICEMFL